ncbi:hypothetical protein Smp_142590 [Schistosoma mansoni]|uniref:hypothetical protein n=1 Tax=Schistosoma mansoni TaxID=6183 RepID=UPI00022DC1E2|nr:hypothetical protein Smp_142590 [Schistosoma mansoni]|eukprot:XP_018648601.1 hypothetical protein Smp_142590 [Schistosoma mansoni]
MLNGPKNNNTIAASLTIDNESTTHEPYVEMRPLDHQLKYVNKVSVSTKRLATTTEKHLAKDKATHILSSCKFLLIL